MCSVGGEVLWVLWVLWWYGEERRRGKEGKKLPAAAVLCRRLHTVTVVDVCTMYVWAGWKVLSTLIRFSWRIPLYLNFNSFAHSAFGLFFSSSFLPLASCLPIQARSSRSQLSCIASIIGIESEEADHRLRRKLSLALSAGTLLCILTTWVALATQRLCHCTAISKLRPCFSKCLVMI